MKYTVRILSAVVATSIILGGATASHAYLVYMRNGTTMEATGHRMEGGKVVVKMRGGNATFELDQVDMDKTARDYEAYKLVLAKAAKMAADGSPSEAADLYRAILAGSPDDMGVRILLAESLTAAGNYDDAITGYQSILEKGPNTPGIRTRLGRVYYERGEYYEAIDQYLLALDQDPDDKAAHLGLGMCYSRQDMLEGAKTELGKALALNPGYAEAHAALGYVHYKKSEPQAALRELETAIDLDEKLPEAHYYMGLVYGIMGVEAIDSTERLDDFDKSIEAFRKAVTLRKFYPEAHADLGVAFYNRGSVARAVEEFNIALEQNPGMAVTHNNLAGIYNHRGFYEAAAAEAKKAVDIDQTLVGAYLIMGNAYANLHRYADAARAYDRYLSFAPNDPLSDEVRMRLDRVLKEGGLDWPLPDEPEDGGV